MAHKRISAIATSSLGVFGLAAIVACGSASNPADPIASHEAEDRIQPFDDPFQLLGNTSRRLADNIRAADVGQTFGVPDDEVPYPDTFWPMTEEGIDVQWNGNEKSPLEKYMLFADPTHLAESRAWNHANQGTGIDDIQGWYGICNGWTGAATSVKPLKHGASAKIDNGRVVACTPGETGCTTFEIGDMNALMATIYSDGFSYFLGARCDTVPRDIERDEFGRIMRREDAFTKGAGCKGLNPGSLMVVLNQRLRVQKKPMVMNAQAANHTEQIWNQPAYRYKVNRYEPLTEAQAANLVASNRREGPLTEYRWNDGAHGFAFVDVTLSWVTEHGPNKEFYSGLRSSRSTRMTFVLETDMDLSNPDTQIIGGEYIDDPSAGTNRLTNAPFLWISTAPGPEHTQPGPGVYMHNPFIKTSVVTQLIELALAP